MVKVYVATCQFSILFTELLSVGRKRHCGQRQQSKQPGATFKCVSTIYWIGEIFRTQCQWKGKIKEIILLVM